MKKVEMQMSVTLDPIEKASRDELQALHSMCVVACGEYYSEYHDLLLVCICRLHSGS